MVANGYHSIGEVDYRKHPLYNGNKVKFVKAYTENRRNDEVQVLRRLSGCISASACRCWMLTLINKRDLWWHDSDGVADSYAEGEYGQLIEEIASRVGSQNFRHEFVLSSLVIGNFTSRGSDVLARTRSGYDQQQQALSLRRFWETIDALRKWETQ